MTKRPSVSLVSQWWLIAVSVLLLRFGAAHYITGPLEGLSCDAESVQEANSAHLHSILKEIANTTFFRLVRVDPQEDGHCPIAGVRGALESGAAHTCGAPAEPFDPFSALSATPSTAAFDPFSAHSEPHDDGGLCSVESESETERQRDREPAETVVTRISAEEQSAQREFPRDNECVIEGTFQIRPDYWLDLCDKAQGEREQDKAQGEDKEDAHYAAEYVNLQLNPERNTGYNGSAVWLEMHGAVAALSSEEGKVLQRLLSGYHFAVTTQIMDSYFPPARTAATAAVDKKKNGKWRRNARKFAETAFLPHADRVKNLHFAFVLLSRSLFRIKDFLYSYSYATGNAASDRATQRLVRHLLDSAVLASCESVVLRGFDESRLFSLSTLSREEERERVATEFKKAFRRLSRMVHCVSCSRCRLHAQLSTHGLGVALKILLTERALVERTLSRDDVVALLNTLHKLSESIQLADEMMAEHYAALAAERETEREKERDAQAAAGSLSVSLSRRDADDEPFPQRDALLQFVSSHRDALTRVEEDALVHALLSRDPQLVLLARHFEGWRFVRHALVSLSLALPDAVVVGGGLAGLVTAASLAQRGGSVVVLEKLSVLGGNSARASSGINSLRSGDARDAELFLQDTLRSQGTHGERALAALLVERANASVAWLERTSGLSLASLGQLGGHAVARTWKPQDGVVGAELMAAMLRVVRQLSPAVRVITHATVTSLIASGERGSERVEGVEYTDRDGVTHTLHARHVVLASGGFGVDRAGLLAQYRPDLVNFPTTLGAHTTGDGIRLALSLSAALVDMDYVQLHPTGFVDPRDRDAHNKVLAAEVLRGAGGVLLDREGRRFTNELGTRKAVTDAMLRRNESDRVFWLVLGERSVKEIAKFTQIYVSRGLLRNVTSVDELRALLGDAALATLREYSESERDDAFGRADRAGLPLHRGAYWLVGEVTPVVHYTMGGVRVDAQGRVLRGDGSAVQALFAVGEVSGGVHGENRLGGNSLLECTVFGRVIGGESIAVHDELSPSHLPRRRFFNEQLLQWTETAAAHTETETAAAHAQHAHKKKELREVSLSELGAHGAESDCWAAVEGLVYDLSRYAEDHPGGAAAIRESCGRDATQRFLVAHTVGLLADAEFFPIGKLVN